VDKIARLSGMDTAQVERVLEVSRGITCGFYYAVYAVLDGPFDASLSAELQFKTPTTGIATWGETATGSTTVTIAECMHGADDAHIRLGVQLTAGADKYDVIMDIEMKLRMIHETTPLVQETMAEAEEREDINKMGKLKHRVHIFPDALREAHNAKSTMMG